ncbi:MAG: DUF4886 domain-containing protein [Ruminococcaceae bacterium]|nr:DUF4886 domain-containing protein [Oscillospiraceae bacterium]
MKILAIGNSFSQDATRYLQQMAVSAGVEDFFVRNCYIGGCSLETHVKCILVGDEAYQYQSDAQMLRMISITEALKREEWDYITVQQCSGYSGKYETYVPYLGQLLTYIKRFAPQAKIVFHRTWAYEPTSTHKHFPFYDCNTQLMHEKLCEASAKACEVHELDMIKVGDAINEIRKLPEFDVLNGGIPITRDGFHLSHEYGRFVAGLVWLKFFTGATPDKVTFIPDGADLALIEKVKTVV